MPRGPSKEDRARFERELPGMVRESLLAEGWSPEEIDETLMSRDTQTVRAQDLKPGDRIVDRDGSISTPIKYVAHQVQIALDEVGPLGDGWVIDADAEYEVNRAKGS